MGKIVAMGGGWFVDPEMESIFGRIKKLSSRRRPQVLFVPTAGGDDPESWEGTRDGLKAMGCDSEVLWLLRNPPSRRQIAVMVRKADIVLVGGGNTLMMMRRWAFLGVDVELRKAYKRGAVLCGGSAGAICWFDYGHSDSMRGYGHDPWDYIRVSGLGLVGGTFCPHYHYENRVEDFHEMIRRKGGFGIACDDLCAIEVVDGHYRILTGSPDAGAYAVIRKRGRIIEKPVEPASRYRPLSHLYDLPWE